MLPHTTTRLSEGHSAKVQTEALSVTPDPAMTLWPGQWCCWVYRVHLLFKGTQRPPSSHAHPQIVIPGSDWASNSSLHSTMHCINYGIQNKRKTHVAKAGSVLAFILFHIKIISKFLPLLITPAWSTILDIVDYITDNKKKSHTLTMVQIFGASLVLQGDKSTDPTPWPFDRAVPYG